MHIPVLMYHRVCENGEGGRSPYVVTAGEFERQLQYFARHGYGTPSIEHLLQSRNNTSGSAKKPLIITFDDGYLDTLEKAVPLVMKYGFSTTVFIMTDFSRQYNWWDDGEELNQVKLMNKSQIKEMSAMGVEIGSHAISHRSLPMLNDIELKDEIERSKKLTEDLFGLPVRYLAYPYGEADTRVEEFVKNAGYECAFATNSGPISFYGNKYRIRRTLISNRSDDTYLYLKLSGLEKISRYGWSLVKKIMGKKPRYHDIT